MKTILKSYIILLLLFSGPVVLYTYGETPFKKGERLVYTVKYKNLSVGTSTLEFKGETMLGGKSVYRVDFITKVPSIKDIEEIYADKETFLPVEVRRRLRKRIGFSDKIIEVYNQRDHRVDIQQKSMLREKDFFIKKDSVMHNAILLVYYFRKIKELKEGERRHIVLPTLEFDVIYEGIEEVETALGPFPAHVFTGDPPYFRLWLTADEKRIPLKIKNPSLLGYSLEIREIK